MCAIEWCADIANRMGTAGDFKAHYDQLSPSALKVGN